MSIKALAIAATGMNAQQTNLEVISNNIANINTTGFKRARAEFTDLMYQNVQSQGVARQAGLEAAYHRPYQSRPGCRWSAVGPALP